MSLSDRKNGVILDRANTVSKKLVVLAQGEGLRKIQDGDTVYMPERAKEKPGCFESCFGSYYKSIYVFFHPSHQSRQEVSAIKVPQEKTTSPSYRSLSVTSATSGYGHPNR